MLRDSWARMPKTDWGKELWTAEERAELFGSREQERAYGLQSIAMLQNYILSADLSVVPLSLEDWLDCDLGGFKIAGRIDRIDQGPDNSVSVWDYKTGKLPFHDSIAKKIKEDLQMPIYAIIASKLYPFAEKIRGGLIYIKYSKVYDITWEKKDIKELEENVLAQIKKAKDEKDFLPRVNKLCPWCEYMNVCPAKRTTEVNKQDVKEVEW
jgi:RecB family exonuclease